MPSPPGVDPVERRPSPMTESIRAVELFARVPSPPRSPLSFSCACADVRGMGGRARRCANADGIYSRVQGATIIIELHDKLMKNSDSFRKDLISKIPLDAKTQIITQKQSPSFENINDLEALSDNDRAVVMSEGRKFFGEWLVIEY